MSAQKFLRNKIFKQVISSLSITLLLISQNPIAFSAIPEKLKINSKYGRIRQTYSASSDKMIIHIQDAHCVYEAQKNIIGMLRDLYKKYNITLVTLEGADSYFDADTLASFPIKSVRQDVADYFLKKGRIAGSEYLMIENEIPFKYRGAENRDLYIENYNAFLSALPKPDDPALLRVKDITSALDSLKDYMLNRSLKELDKYSIKYSAQKISFSEYAKYLKEQAEHYNIPMEQYKNINIFFRLKQEEASIDFTKIHAELTTAINQLTDIISKEQLSQLLYKNLFYKLEKIDPQDFFSYLTELGAQYSYDFTPLSNLTQYIAYLDRYKNINEIAILDEEKKLLREIQNQLYDNPAQRKLMQLTNDSHILKRLLELKVTKDELHYYTKNKDLFTADRFVSFIKKHVPTYQVPFNMFADYTVITQRLPVLDNFYKIAAERNEALIENTLAEMDLEDTNTAILITGGFHSEGITKILRREGISYTVVSPNLTKQPQSDLYLTRLAGIPTEAEQMLTAQRLSVPLVLGETPLVEGQNTDQFKQAFKALLDIDTAVKQIPEQLPATYEPTITFLDAFSIKEYPVLDTDGTPTTAMVKFVAFKLLSKTYMMAVVPEGMDIEGSIRTPQNIGNHNLVLIQPDIFLSAQQNIDRETITVASSSLDYYLNTAMVAGVAATPNTALIPDLNIELEVLTDNNLAVVADDGSILPTFAYLVRSGITPTYIQPKVAKVTGLFLPEDARSYIQEQGITQLTVFSNHSQLTAQEAQELNDNLATILRDGKYQLATGKNIHAVVQDGIAQIFSTQDKSIKPFVPIPQSVFEAMVPNYKQLNLASTIEAKSQGYVELGVVNGRVTITLYRIDKLGKPSVIEAFHLSSPDAPESDIFNLILKARQRAYTEKIGLLGYGNPNNGIGISFANLDELMAGVNGNPVRKAVLNVLSALSILPAFSDLTQQTLKREGVNSVPELTAYLQSKTPNTELPKLTCAACATAVVHDNLQIGDIAYTRQNFEDYAQFLLQMMLFIDARQRPAGIEKIDDQVFNSMYSMSVAFQLAGRNTQAVSVVPAGEQLNTTERNTRLTTVLKTIPLGESIVIALKTKDNKGHFIAIRKNEQGYEIYDALAEQFIYPSGALSTTELSGTATAVGGIDFIINSYLPNTYGKDAFTGQILVGQSVSETGEALSKLLKNGDIRNLNRQEQLSVTGAMFSGINILQIALKNISPDMLIVLRDHLDKVLLFREYAQYTFGEFGSKNYFENVFKSAGKTQITEQESKLFSILRNYQQSYKGNTNGFIRALIPIIDELLRSKTKPRSYSGLFGASHITYTIGTTNPLMKADLKILEIIQNHLSTAPEPTVNQLMSLSYWYTVLKKAGVAKKLLLPSMPVIEYLLYSSFNRQTQQGTKQITDKQTARQIKQTVGLYLAVRQAKNPTEMDKVRKKYADHPFAVVSQITLQTVWKHLLSLRKTNTIPAQLADRQQYQSYWKNIFRQTGEEKLFKAEGSNLTRALWLEAKALYKTDKPKGAKKPFTAKFFISAGLSLTQPFIASTTRPAVITETTKEKLPPNVDAIVNDPLADKKRAVEREIESEARMVSIQIRAIQDSLTALNQNSKPNDISRATETALSHIGHAETATNRLISDDLKSIMNPNDRELSDNLKTTMNHLRSDLLRLREEGKAELPVFVSTLSSLKTALNKISNRIDATGYAQRLERQYAQKIQERIWAEQIADAFSKGPEAIKKMKTKIAQEQLDPKIHVLRVMYNILRDGFNKQTWNEYKWFASTVPSEKWWERSVFTTSNNGKVEGAGDLPTLYEANKIFVNNIVRQLKQYIPAEETYSLDQKFPRELDDFFNNEIEKYASQQQLAQAGLIKPAGMPATKETQVDLKKETDIKEALNNIKAIIANIGSLRELVVRISHSPTTNPQTVKAQFEGLKRNLIKINVDLQKLSSDKLQLILNQKDKENILGLKNAMNTLYATIKPLLEQITDNAMSNARPAKDTLTRAWKFGQMRSIFDSIVSLSDSSSFAIDLRKSLDAKLADRLRTKKYIASTDQQVGNIPIETVNQVRPAKAIALQIMLDELTVRANDSQLKPSAMLSFGLSDQFWQYAVFTDALNSIYGVNVPQLFTDQNQIIQRVLTEAYKQGNDDAQKTFSILIKILKNNIRMLEQSSDGIVMNRYSQDFLDTINTISQALGLADGQLLELMGDGSFALVNHDGVFQIEGSPRNALALISRIQGIPVQLNSAKGTYHELVESITDQKTDIVTQITQNLSDSEDNTPQARTKLILQTVFAQRYNMTGQPLDVLVREAIAKIFTNDILPADIVSEFYSDASVAEASGVLKSTLKDIDPTIYQMLTSSVSTTAPQSIGLLVKGMEKMGLSVPNGIDKAVVDNKIEQWFNTVFSTELMAGIELYNNLPIADAIKGASRSDMVRRSIMRAQERAKLQNVIPHLTTLDFNFLINDTVRHIVNNVDKYYDAQGKPTRKLLNYIADQGGISDTRTLGLAQLIQQYSADKQNVFAIYSLDQTDATIKKVLDLYGISPSNTIIIDSDELNSRNADTPILGLPEAIQAQLNLEDGLKLHMSDLVLIATDPDIASFTANHGAKVYLSPSGILPQNFSVGNKLTLGFNVFQAATRMAQGEKQFANLIISYVAEDNIFIRELIKRIKKRTGSNVVTLEQLVEELGGLKALGELNRNDVEGIVLSFPERIITQDDIKSEFLNRLKMQRAVETSA